MKMKSLVAALTDIKMLAVVFKRRCPRLSHYIKAKIDYFPWLKTVLIRKGVLNCSLVDCSVVNNLLTPREKEIYGKIGGEKFGSNSFLQ